MGDGRLGYPDGAPYDAIHVGAAAATVPKAVRMFWLLLLWLLAVTLSSLKLYFVSLEVMVKMSNSLHNNWVFDRTVPSVLNF